MSSESGYSYGYVVTMTRSVSCQITVTIALPHQWEREYRDANMMDNPLYERDPNDGKKVPSALLVNMGPKAVSLSSRSLLE